MNNISLEHILITLGFLIILNIFLLFQVYKLKKGRKILFQDPKPKNLEEILIEQKSKIQQQEKEAKKMAEKITELEKISQKSFQKIGLVRFNPFKSVGGNQSFSIALLDAQDNGFVISSLYTREENRIYAKPIRQGKSEYALSEEEKQAIKKAIGL